MVSRPGLAVILLALSVWLTGLMAETVSPGPSAPMRPVYLSEAPALELSATDASLPQRVLIRIAVFPDSSYTLLSVEPANLRAEVERYLRQTDLMGYLDDKTPGVKELEIRVSRIDQTRMDVPDHTTEPELRQRIDDWIFKQRELDSPGAVWRDWLDPLASEDLNYRSATNVSGLHTGTDPLRQHGMDLANTPLAKVQRLNWLRSIYSSAVAYDHYDEPYPYEILLTGLNAGMGEFDSRYAKVRAARNGLLGREGLFYGLDLTVSSGDWLNLSSAQTNIRQSLRIPLGKLGLELDYASFAADQASISLHPSYWRAPLYGLERKGELLWTRLSSPWLDLAYSRSREALQSSVFAFRPLSLMHQLQAAKELQMGKIKMGASWIHAWRENNLLLPLESYQSEYKDLGAVKLDYQGDKLTVNASAALADLADLMAEGSVAYRFGKLACSAGLKADFSDYQPRVAVTDIYTSNAELESVDLRERQRLWMKLDWQPGALKLALTAGRKDYQIALPNSGNTLQYKAAPLFVGLGGVYDLDLGFMRAILRQNLLWTQEQEHTRDDPAIRGSGELELRRDLSYNNAIFAALGYTFHSSYLNLAVQPDVLDFSLIADARFGVRISKLFEIDAGIRNLGDNYIFGVYPIPFSLHASVRWYFVN